MDGQTCASARLAARIETSYNKSHNALMGFSDGAPLPAAILWHSEHGIIAALNYHACLRMQAAACDSRAGVSTQMKDTTIFQPIGDMTAIPQFCKVYSV